MLFIVAGKSNVIFLSFPALTIPKASTKLSITGAASAVVSFILLFPQAVINAKELIKRNRVIFFIFIHTTPFHLLL